MIREIEIKNIKSHTDLRVKFTDGINAIIGKNGAGKSTIIECIGYVLFDSLPYKIDEFVKYGNKYGEIRLSIDDYTLYRRVGINPKYEIYRGSELIARNKQEYVSTLTSIIGKSSDIKDIKILWEQISGVPQGSFTAMFLQPPEARKMLFNNMLGIDKYKRYYKDMGEYVKQVKQNIQDLKDDYLRYDYLDSEIESIMEEIKNIENSINIERDRYKDMMKDYEELEKEYRRLDGIKQTQTELNNKIQMLDISINNASKWKSYDFQSSIDTIKDLEEQIKKKDNIIKSLSELSDYEKLEKEQRKLKVVVDNIKSKITTLKEKKRMKEEMEKKLNSIVVPDKMDKSHLIKRQDDIRKEINEYKQLLSFSVEGTTCPLLHRDCPLMVNGEVDIDVKSLNTKILALTKEMDNIADEITKIDQHNSNIQLLNHEVNSLTSKIEEIGDITTKINKLSINKDIYETKLEAIEMKMDKLKNYKVLKAELNTIYEKENSLNRIKNEMKEMEQLKVKYDELVAKKMSLLNQLKQLPSLSNYDNIKNKLSSIESAMATEDALIKSLENDAIVKKEKLNKLEQLKNERGKIKDRLDREEDYLAFVGNVRDLLKVVPGKIFVRIKDIITQTANEFFNDMLQESMAYIELTDDYNIIVSDSKGLRNFKQLSGGEQMMAAISVRLAIGKILSGLPFMMLDEPTSYLDENRRLYLAENISHLKGFEQLFIITHDNSFEGYVSNVIKV